MLLIMRLQALGGRRGVAARGGGRIVIPSSYTAWSHPCHAPVNIYTDICISQYNHATYCTYISFLFFSIIYTILPPPLSLSLSSFSLSLSLSLGLLKPRIRSLSDGWIEAGTPSAERPSLWKGGAGGSFWGQVASF